MNKLIFVILFTLIFKPVFPIVDYFVNYHYISTVLCVNKDKPKLKCCGKCYLKKELAKASEVEKPIQSNKKDNSKHEIVVLFFQDFKLLIKEKYTSNKKTYNKHYYSNFYQYMNCYSEFHPPKFS